MQDFVIQPQEGRKGRSFQGTAVAIVTASGLCEASGGSCCRPVWAMFAGPDASLRPFVTNLKLGRKADPIGKNMRNNSEERIEFMKSVGYYVSWQKEPEGSLATIYHPDLFRVDPGMVDPDGIQFVLLVPSDWAEHQKVQINEEQALAHLKRVGLPTDKVPFRDLVVASYLMAAYLDRRTHCPLVADGLFYLQLMVAALDQGLASTPSDNLRWGSTYREWGYQSHHGFRAAGLDSVGIRQAYSFLAKHEQFDKFLAEQVTLFFS